MTVRLSETEATEYLDRMGALDRARRPGVYALRLETPPDDDIDIINQWFDAFEASPPGGLPSRLADCDRFVYVGCHHESVYERICQHCNGVKSSTIMSVWPPVEIDAVWPTDAPAEMEWSYANEMATETTRVWCNGELL